MNDSFFHFNKNNFNQKKTKEEEEEDIARLPKHIGPYEIVEKIKDGGYSKIYKATSCYTGDFVAIKTIDKQCFQESVEDVLLMVRQTEVLKILKHRNIISLYEIYESTKYFYLVMDYLPNGDLIEKIIKQKRFKEEEALNIFSQLVDALYYMHKNEICHRDIRTEKILFDKNNKPKIVGFSYSTFYTQGKKMKDNYGSLCYACPEIIQNDPYNPELADVWSLGVVLYVMICGYLPFSEEDDEKNKQLIIKGEIEYPTEISNKLKDLLKHMLEVDAKKRYTFQRIVKHPWFKPYSESTLTGGVNIYKMIYPVDERILKIIVIYGFNKKEIDMDLKQNKFNLGTGLYKHLTNKFLNMGFRSYSDLCSEDFMEFKNDQSNIITNGDKKYKKYISKILDKIKKVERYVNEYKRKEDTVVRDLETIYANAKEEEMKRNTKKEPANNNNKKENNINNNNNYNYQNLKGGNIRHTNTSANIKGNDLKHFHRRTISPMMTIKEQKGIKDFLASRIGYIKKESNNFDKTNDNLNFLNDDDFFDIPKDLQEGNKINEFSSFIPIEDEEPSKRRIKRHLSANTFRDLSSILMEKDEEASSILSVQCNEGQNLEEENDKPFRRKRLLSVMLIKKKKRTYLNNSSINDSFLRKPKNERQRKRLIKDSLINSIKQVIIEENLNEGNIEPNTDKEKNNKINKIKIDKKSLMLNMESLNNNKDNNPMSESKEEEREIKKSETKRGKNLKYSLSFGDDDDDDVEESGFISKIDSKQVSLYDFDEELKELKEIRNTLKSPAGPFLKRNANDNKLINFNMENTSVIFGEHLDDNNVTTNTNATQIAGINERYDILTQLKKAYEKGSTEIAKSNYEGDTKIIENNQFKDDSFGESKNYKLDYNPIVFDDRVEISFHDENNPVKKSTKNLSNYNGSFASNIVLNGSNNNNYGVSHNNSIKINNNNNGSSGFMASSFKINNNKEEIIFYHNDKKVARKINSNQLEEYLTNINLIDSKKHKKFTYKFINDEYFNKKIKMNIFEDNLNIANIELKRTKKKKEIRKENLRYRPSKEKTKLKILNKELTTRSEIRTKNVNFEDKSNTNKSKNSKTNYSNDNLSNLSKSINITSVNDSQTHNISSKMNTIESYMTNPLLSDHDSSNHCCNEDKQNKIYIIDNLEEDESIVNYNKINSNNIIINTNNNTINNISINNKNNYGNYYEQNRITNNKYFISQKKKNNNNKNTPNYVKKNIKKTSNSREMHKEKTNANRNKIKKKNNNELIKTIDEERKFLMTNQKTKKYSDLYCNTSKNNKTISKTNHKNTMHKYNKNDIKASLLNKEKNKNLQINLKKDKNNNKSVEKEKKKRSLVSSIERTLHTNLMSNEYEMPEEKSELLSKVKKGQKIYQCIVNDKSKGSKLDFLNKFIIAREKKDNNNKNNTYKDKKDNLNYTQEYHKRVKSNNNSNLNSINNSMKRDAENQGHNKTKSDFLVYDYLFSVYNEKNKNNENISIIYHPKGKARNISAENIINENQI